MVQVDKWGTTCTLIGDNSDVEKEKKKEVDQKTGTTDVKMSEADRDSGNLCTHVGDNSDVKQEEEKALDCETRITDTNTDHSEITFQISISKRADNIDQCNKTCTENSNVSVQKEQSKELSENPVSKLVCDNLVTIQLQRKNQIHSLKIQFLRQFVTIQSPMNVKRRVLKTVMIHV